MFISNFAPLQIKERLTNMIKRIAAISALALLLATGVANAKTPGISSIANKIDASSLSKIVLSDNNSADVKPTEDETTDKIKPLPPIFARKAMTWKMGGSPLVLDGKTYALFGSDNGQPGGTNPYQGDTSINEYRSLLCIKKTGATAPAGLPSPTTTDGGANKASWSGGKVLIIPNIQGKRLKSQAVADKMCEKAGQITHGTSGYRMAEFHDGTGINPGWSFWAEADDDINGSFVATRFWVRINDQPANPWDN